MSKPRECKGMLRLVAMTMILPTAAAATDAGDGDLLELVRAGHKQTFEAIVSLHAKYQTKTSTVAKDVVLVSEIDWWQSSGSFKWREVEKDETAKERLMNADLTKG